MIMIRKKKNRKEKKTVTFKYKSNKIRTQLSATRETGLVTLTSRSFPNSNSRGLFRKFYPCVWHYVGMYIIYTHLCTDIFLFFSSLFEQCLNRKGESVCSLRLVTRLGLIFSRNFFPGIQQLTPRCM